MTVDGKEVKVTYHNFPSDSSINLSKRKQWLRAIRRDVGKNFRPSRWTKICSLHFKETDFYNFFGRHRTLREDAVPSVFPFYGDSSGTNLKAPSAQECTPCDGPRCTRSGRLLGSALETISPGCELSLQEPLNSLSAPPLQELNSPARLCSPAPRSRQESNHSLEHTEDQSALEILKAENEALKQCLNQLKMANVELTNELKLAETRRFCFENIQDSDDDVHFHTGLPSSSVFYELLHYLSPERMRSNVVYRATAQNWVAKPDDPANAPWRETSTSQGRPPKLSQVNELFLTLVRLRLNLKEQDLARRFDISPSSVSRVFITWINYAYLRLGMLPIWPDRTIIKETMPASFKERYPKTTVIVDATEIKVNVPSSLLLQSQTYSNYKSANTLKGLLAISPAGHVTFVSSLYTGSIADKELVERSGFLSLLTRGDEIMADRGFTINELLAPLGVSLNTPPTLRNRQQMDGKEVIETQQIASLRIHIERAIRRVKEFDILNGVIPAALSGSANQIWTVCALLTNFQPPLLTC